MKKPEAPPNREMGYVLSKVDWLVLHLLCAGLLSIPVILILQAVL